jgi:selenocysteine lyase/cysteine desulfurase
MHPGARGQFDLLEHTYLDTASYGIPPAQTLSVLRSALSAWAQGSADWISDWDTAGDRCRVYASDIFGAPPEEIALLPAVSVGVATALSGIGKDDEILVADDEFASALLPVLAAAEQRGCHVRRTTFGALADQVSPGTTFVVSSHVRSNDGRVQDLLNLADAAHSVGASLLVDATHSAGILPIDSAGLGLDVVISAAYKHLLCPRGVCLMRIAPDRWPLTPAIHASWRSAAEPYSHYYGGDLSVLSPNAARFDVSLAWHAWVGAEASLAFLSGVQATDRRDWCIGLANSLAAQLGIAPTGSSLVRVPVVRGDEARAALRHEGIVGSGRDSYTRLSFHLYNDKDDVDRAAQVLTPYVSHER